MNIIELAKQAGMVYREFENEFANANTDGVDLKTMQAFAALVAAHEHEECAKLCEAEADDGTEGEWDGCCLFLAEQIRARSNT